jgi:polysaccharide deacetylase family protein (PEP-CTERM system associated)
MSPGETSRAGFFTIDVEDWYHPLVRDPSLWSSQESRIVGPMRRLLQLLAETQNKATFFVLGDVAVRHPELVDAIQQGGHEVGCHGHNHLTLKGLKPEAFKEDLRKSLAALRTAGAKKVVSFRAPFFSLDESNMWALQILADEGIRIDSSIFPLRTGYYGINGARAVPHQLGPILEVPISLPTLGGVRLPLNGGFYARFFPRWLTNWGLRRQFSSNPAPMYYIHPWELDPAQPRLPVGRFLAFRHYLRLENTDGLIQDILKRYRWRPLADLVAQPGSPEAPSTRS